MSKTRIEKLNGIAHLILDDPDEKLNTLGAQMLDELIHTFISFGTDPEVKAVVVRSAKAGGFIAGANIEEIKSIALGENAEKDGIAAAIKGQTLMNTIEDLSKPVVAAVHGACLGGGFELAMACHARVVATDSKTKLGLPELQLGIVPGFGGTWRLPKLAGLVAGITAILSSSKMDSRKCYKLGLADDVAAPERLVDAAHQLAVQLLQPGALRVLQAERAKKKSAMTGLMEWPLVRKIVFNKSRASVMEKTGGHYPAPLMAIDQIQKHFMSSRDAAMLDEAQALGKSMATPVAQNLLRFFFVTQLAKKQGGEGKAVTINDVAIVGAGFMGSSIAIPAVTRADWNVLLKDADLGTIGRALKKIWGNIQKSLKRRRYTPAEARQKFDKVSSSLTYSGFEKVELVIEAVPEILDLKHKIFSQIEDAVSDSTIVATNTSTLPIDDLSAKAVHPERFIGMHFFSPAEIMPLVEIIPGSKTSTDVTATIVKATQKMGKTPVVVKDSPGFLVNRILMPYIVEACAMVEEGVPVEQIDKQAVKFGMPMGPIRLMGEVGIPVIVKVFHILMEHFSDHMPAPAWIEREDLEKAFPRGEDKKIHPDGAKIAAWSGKSNPSYPDEDVSDRLFHAMLNEGARCMSEGIVDDARLLDLAMVMGTGFPPFKGGLMREADVRGLKNVVSRSKVLADKYGKHLTAPQGLLDQAEGQGSYRSD